ncbi:ABC transporter permease subunit [Clostridium sp. UBA1056]|uniref:ABC transporter permease subunit n=1 Tax=unclassified Clostridium TaxID=2614128 RepID=UPI0032174654
MTAEKMKIIVKKILVNILMLLIILFIVIAVTGIPVDFGITSSNGISKPNMEINVIFENIKNNFKVFLNGEAFNVMIQGETIGQLLTKTATKSLSILFFGTILAIIIGIPKGIIDSRKKDRSGTIKLLQSLIPLSVPDVLTIALVQGIAIYLYNNKVSIFGLGPLPAFGDETFGSAIYPIISIAILPAAYIARIAATTIEENFTKPYILAAKGKGCSRFQIIKNHMMKNIIYGVLSGFPTVMGIMFSSLIIVERLFYFRGMGYYLILFYTSELIPPYEAGVAFTAFIVFLAILYYFIFMIFNSLKNIILPKTKSY